MGLFSSDDDEEQKLTEEEEKKLNKYAGFEHAEWTNYNAFRVIDWEAEVVIYFFTNSTSVVHYETDAQRVIDGWGGAGMGGMTAVPLSQTAIDPDEYNDPRGTTQEQL